MPKITDDPWAADEEDTSTDAAEGAAPEKGSDEAEKGSSTASEDSDGVEAPTEAEKPPAAKRAAKKAPAKKAAAKKAAEAKPEEAKPEEGKPAIKSTGSLGATLSDMTTFVTELVYGPEGTGKTTDALRMTRLHPTKKVILIDAEAGAKVRALKDRGVDVSRVEVWPKPEDGGPAALSFEGLYDLGDQLLERAEEYIGWVWDSGGEITKRLLDQVTAEARAKDASIGKQRGRFQINLEDHGVASSMLRELLRKYRDLPMHGVITALERRDVDEDTGKVKYGPAMSPAMANDAAGLVDVVLYKEISTISGENVRTGRCVPTKTRRAKDRFGVLPPNMADPFFDRIVGYVNGDLTRENDEVQAHIRDLIKQAQDAKNTNQEGGNG